jgi:hypothetical protein
MDLLTFVGTGRYFETQYEWNGERIVSSFVAEALAQRMLRQGAALRVLLGVTPVTAEHENAGKIRERLEAHGVEVAPVAIPEGRDEAELWTIFGTLAEHVDIGSKLAIDITHALRSIPVIGVALACYLREVRQVEVAHILYGAYELTDRATNVTPIVEVTPFLQMIEWVTAARILATSGDARPLAKLLQEKAPGVYAPTHGEDLSRLGSALAHLSEALAVNRPVEAGDQAERTLQRLDRLPERFGPASAPFPLIRDALKRTYEPIRSGDSEAARPGDLERERRLVEWYVERGRYVQAVMLARESVLSYAVQLKEAAGAGSVRARQPIADALGYAARKLRNAGQADENQHVADFTGPADRDLVKLWDALTEVRNNLAHCGYGRGDAPREIPAKTVVNTAKQLPDRLRALTAAGGRRKEKPR